MSRAAEHGARVFALVWSQNSSVDDEHDAAGGGALGAPPDVEIAAAARGAADDDATQAASVRCYACGRGGAWAVRCTTMHAACTHKRARFAKQTQSSASVPPSSTAPSRARGVTGDAAALAREHSDNMFRLVWSQDSSGDEEQAAAAGSVPCAPPPGRMAAARGAAEDTATQAASVRATRAGARAWARRGRYHAQRSARCEHIFTSTERKHTQSSAEEPASAPSRAGGITGDAPTTVRSARVLARIRTARLFTRARMAVSRSSAACVNAVSTDRGGSGEPRGIHVRGR